MFKAVTGEMDFQVSDYDIRTVRKTPLERKGAHHLRVPLSAWNGSFYTLVPWVHWSPRPRLLFFQCSLDSSGHRASEVLADYMFAENL